MDKDECREAGLRFSRRRETCYFKCISKAKSFDNNRFKCVTKDEVKAAVEAVKEVIEGDVKEPVAVKLDET